MVLKQADMVQSTELSKKPTSASIKTLVDVELMSPMSFKINLFFCKKKPNQQHRMDLPPMLGSQDVAMMARAAAATASPPQAPSGPSQLQNAVKEAAAKIKIVMEKTAKVPKGTGLGNLMPL